jgi:catechol 2,3-dioxygenase-like lactoylglutathione lyase family enzyme
MGVLRVNHTAVSVRDMDVSLAFYVDALGLELVAEIDIDHAAGLEAVVGLGNVTARMALLRAGDTEVELWCYAEPVGAPVPPTASAADLGVRHVAFAVDDLGALYARLVADGYRFNSPPVDLGLHLTCYLHGPDAELIELLEDRSDPARWARIHQRTLARRAGTGA